jgi:hypothetical protein
MLAIDQRNKAYELNKTKSNEFLSTFPFDWNDYRTFKRSEELMQVIFPFLKETLKTAYRRSNDPYTLLSVKVARYLLHMNSDTESTDLAITLLERAKADYDLPFHWERLHLAFGYQKKLAEAKKQRNISDIEKYYQLTLKYCEMPENNPEHLWNKDNQALLKSGSTPAAQIIAFSLCVKALAYYEHGDLQTAIATYRSALDMYEGYNLIDDQYMRAKNRWAMMLVENKEIERAALVFKDIKDYWDKAPRDNPFIVRFLFVYTNFLEEKNRLLEAELAAAKQPRSSYSPALFAEGAVVTTPAMRPT